MNKVIMIGHLARDIEPVWVNFSIYDLFYLKSDKRERLLEEYKKLKDKQ